MRSEFEFSEEYKKAPPHEQALLDELADILHEVQYAKEGTRASARRQAAIDILDAIKLAYMAVKL